MEKPQPDTHSTFAIGEVAPDPSHTAKIESVHNQKETVAVPCGPPKSTGTKSQFVHDEYVVYDVKQVTMRYVFIVGKKGRCFVLCNLILISFVSQSLTTRQRGEDADEALQKKKKKEEEKNKKDKKKGSNACASCGCFRPLDRGATNSRCGFV